MRTDIVGNKEGYYDWYGGCDPTLPDVWHGVDTFSVGIFQWLKKSRGKELKRGKVICRVVGLIRNPDAVYASATEICRECDRGFLPERKSFRVCPR